MPKLSIFIPLLYIAVLVGSMAVFSSLYRKRKARRESSLEPWFGPHVSRDIYLTLLHMETDPPVPQSLLKASLLRRATEDVNRIITIRSAKQSLLQLLQRGSIGDDLWTRFVAADKEIEEELRDVVLEANAFKPDWGATILRTANEILLNERVRERAKEVSVQVEQECAWWNERREKIQKELLGGNPEAPSDEDTVLVEPQPAQPAPRPSTPYKEKGKGGKQAASGKKVKA